MQPAPPIVTRTRRGSSRAIVPPYKAFPTIVGTPVSGRVLRATVGKWANSPRHFSFQWYDENTPIPGATHSTYRVTNNDVDHTLDVSVTAANGRGDSRPAPSLATGTAVLPCGRVVSSASALISAVDNGNSPGKATCVRAGTYSVHSLDGHHSTMTTIEAYPGDQLAVLSGSIGLGRIEPPHRGLHHDGRLLHKRRHRRQGRRQPVRELHRLRVAAVRQQRSRRWQHHRRPQPHVQRQADRRIQRRLRRVRLHASWSGLYILFMVLHR